MFILLLIHVYTKYLTQYDSQKNTTTEAKVKNRKLKPIYSKHNACASLNKHNKNLKRNK